MADTESQNKAPPTIEARIRAINSDIEQLLKDPTVNAVRQHRSIQNAYTRQWKFFYETLAEHLHGALDELHLGLDVVIGQIGDEPTGGYRDEFEDERLTARQLGVA